MPRADLHIAIIGGGASGVLMAAHLLRQTQADGLKVTIIEGRNMLGCGVAYSTRDPHHLLNTRVLNMSAYPREPEHFLHWLQSQKGYEDATPACFVSRETYGRYMAELLTPWLSTGQGRLSCLRQNCTGVKRNANGVTLQFEDGTDLQVDRVILATGHIMPPKDPDGLLAGSWDWQEGTSPEAKILIIGSGLSMVDQVLSLLKQGHQGPILALSRRGLLPRDHAAVKPLPITAEDVPFGASASRLLAWARAQARHAQAIGGTWRDAIDGIRPFVRAIWQRLPLSERRRFIRHAAPYWDVHRHRIPPQSAELLQKAFATGQLRQIRGRFLKAQSLPDGQIEAQIHTRQGLEPIAVTRVVDCRGILRDPVENASPLIRSLLDQGLARIDPLNIGLDVAPDCGLRDHEGKASRHILAIGPVSRAAFWEITAIPDIREQTQLLAQKIATEIEVPV